MKVDLSCIQWKVEVLVRSGFGLVSSQLDSFIISLSLIGLFTNCSLINSTKWSFLWCVVFLDTTGVQIVLILRFETGCVIF